MSDGALYQEALGRIAKRTELSPDEVARRIKEVRESMSEKTADCLTASAWQSWRASALPEERQQHLSACAFCTKVSRVQLR